MQQHVPESCTSAGLFKAVRRLAQRARVSPSCNFIRATRCLRQLVLILLASDILPASSSPFLSAQQGAISDQITMPAAQKFTEGCTTFLFNGAGADRASCSICKPAEADPHAACDTKLHGRSWCGTLVICMEGRHDGPHRTGMGCGGGALRVS